MEHPRWGLIQSLIATRQIKAGEELYTNYGYSYTDEVPFDVPWYWELKRDMDKKSRLDGKKNTTI